MKKIDKNKTRQLLMASMVVVMLCISTIGGIYAWSKLSASVTNKIKTPTVDTEVVETFDEESKVDWLTPVTKEVQFKNTGTAPVFMRVSYAEFWKSNDNKILSGIVNGQEIATKNWTSSWQNEWVDGNDGWYYYKKVLQPDQLTSRVMESLTFHTPELNPNPYVIADYTLKFASEAVQYSSKDMAVNHRAVTANFGVDFISIDSNGNITWK